MSVASASGAAWNAQRRRVLDRDGWVCTSCGSWLAFDHPDPRHDATVDHIEAVIHNAGKVYDDSELASMCRSCNSAKGDRPLVRVTWWDREIFPNGLPC
ncbi:HNH endonuclease [Microbacterium dextranolyticum]|uniref:HNH domain-containing protein n=1 Tax=Microbacterium dextranolyticum TaxID=36806 RepID=A0A9W6M6K5_9MICO|nr:HNH endonuclease [Microbacterium dextranolyticum]MBM7462923.1 5-methylcytosine-specific restriction endonuclease McrA [Microbacterium dextranolyticum]GLJ95972.1 hypothetical protein GCM10017591_20350 [Microbacterium dextranolyticum]